MNRLFAVLFLALAVPAGMVACDADSQQNDGGPGGTATATATATSTVPGDRTPAPVPGLFIVDLASGDGTSAEPGTRCWYGTCIDYIGPVTNAAPVEFDGGASLGWQAEGGTIETISHAWAPAAGLNSEPGEGSLAWHMVDTIDFVEGDIVVPTEPGEYILVMFARYTSGDDVMWGLLVRAR